MPDDPQVESLKLPPHSPEAEQSVLGGLLLDNEAVDKVGDLIVDADFYSDAHRLVFAHIVQLVADGKPADVVTVSEALASVQTRLEDIMRPRNPSDPFADKPEIGAELRAALRGRE